MSGRGGAGADPAVDLTGQAEGRGIDAFADAQTVFEVADGPDEPDDLVGPGETGTAQAALSADFQSLERRHHGWSIALSILLCLIVLGLLGWAGLSVARHYSQRSVPQDDSRYRVALAGANQGRARLRRALDSSAKPLSVLTGSLSSSAEVQKLSQTWNSGQDLLNNPPRAFTHTPTSQTEVSDFITGLTGYTRSLNNTAYSLDQQVGTAGRADATALLGTSTSLMDTSVQQAQLVLSAYEAEAARLCLVDPAAAQSDSAGTGGSDTSGGGAGPADGSPAGQSKGCAGKTGQTGSTTTAGLPAGAVVFPTAQVDAVRVAVVTADGLLRSPTGVSPVDDVNLANRMTTATQQLDDAVKTLQQSLGTLPAAPAPVTGGHQ